MTALSNSEEQLMQYLWKQKKAFMKDLIDAYDDPKPATTTIATRATMARMPTPPDKHAGQMGQEPCRLSLKELPPIKSTETRRIVPVRKFTDRDTDENNAGTRRACKAQ